MHIYAHAYKYFMNQIFVITSSFTKLLYHENLKKYDMSQANELTRCACHKNLKEYGMSQANELTRCVRMADRVFLKGQ